MNSWLLERVKQIRKNREKSARRKGLAAALGFLVMGATALALMNPASTVTSDQAEELFVEEEGQVSLPEEGQELPAQGPADEANGQQLYDTPDLMGEDLLIEETGEDLQRADQGEVQLTESPAGETDVTEWVDQVRIRTSDHQGGWTDLGTDAVVERGEIGLAITVRLPAGQGAAGEALKMRLPEAINSRGGTEGEIYGEKETAVIGSWTSDDAGLLTLQLQEDLLTASADQERIFTVAYRFSTDQLEAGADSWELVFCSGVRARLTLGEPQKAQEQAGEGETESETQSEAGRETQSESETQSEAESEAQSEVRSEELLFAEEDETLAPRAGMYLRAAGRAARTLAAYIKSVTAQKMINGKWTDTTVFTDGDEARFTLNYGIPTGAVDAGASLTYQLDSAMITLAETVSGELFQGTVPVGTVTVDTSGLVTISLNDSFDPAKAFEGNVFFRGIVHNTSGGQGQVIDFSDKASIVVNPKAVPSDHDMTVKKEGWTLADGKIRYRVTVSSAKGTGDPVSVKDSLSGNGISVSYDDSTIRSAGVWKNGTSYVAAAPYISSEGKLCIDDLPALAAGESYTIEYTVTPPSETISADGSASVDNSIVAWNRYVTQYGWNRVEYRKPYVTKTGSVDTAAGKIKWTVVINNPERKDLQGNVLRDVLTVENGEPIELPESFVITGAGGWTGTGRFQNGVYTFPPGMTDESYTITYETVVPSGQDGQTTTVKNQAEYTHDGKTHTGKAGDIGITQPDYGVTKYAPAAPAVSADTGQELEWSARIDLPGTVTLSKIAYIDEMTASSEAGELTGSHYTTPAKLTETLSIWSGAGTLEPGTDYRVYDGSGRDITQSQSADAITSFRIEFLQDRYLAGQSSVSLRYRTIMDDTGQKVGEIWRIKNKGSIPGHDSRAEYWHKKEGILDKQSSAPGRVNGDATSFGSNSTQITFAQEGVIHYRLLLKIPQGTAGDIVLTDTLPAGLVYQAASLRAAFYENDYYEADVRYLSDGGTYRVSDHVSASEPAAQEDGGSLVTFTIAQAGYRGGDSIVLYYDAKIADEEYWGDPRNLTKNYENRVRWGNIEDQESTTVHHKVKKVEKEGRLTQEAGTSRIDYHVIVNPQAADLVPGKETVTLTDQLTSSETDTQVSFLPDQLAVYAYDKDAAANDHKGELINENRYSYRFDEKTENGRSVYTITLELPDSLACVVAYRYAFAVGSNPPTISNTAALSGVAEGSSTEETKLSTQSAGGSVSRRELYLYKVDQDNYRKKLSGVTFALESYAWENGQAVWTSEREDLVTDSEGMIYLNKIDDDLSTDTLYRLRETDVGMANASAGYQMSEKPYYFVWKEDASKRDDEVWNGITRADESGAKQSEVKFMDRGGSLYVPNENASLAVQKVWLDWDNADLAQTPDGAQVTLWRQKKDLVSAKVRVSVSAPYGGMSAARSFSQTVKPGTEAVLVLGPYVQDGVTFVYQGNTYSREPGDYYGVVRIPLGVISGDTDIAVTSGTDLGWDWLSGLTLALQAEEPNEYANVGEAERVTNDASGNPIPSTVSLDAQGGWQYRWHNLPAEDAEGALYYYYVTETAIPGFAVSYSDNNGKVNRGTLTVTNKKEKPVKISVSAEKQWAETDGSKAPAPEGAKVVFGLLADGVDTHRRIELDGVEDEGGEVSPWTALFSELEASDASGKPIRYQIKEMEPYPGYGADEDTVDDGGTIVNRRQASYSLPETGGRGTFWIYAGSLTLLALAALLYIIQANQRKHGQHAEKKGDIR